MQLPERSKFSSWALLQRDMHESFICFFYIFIKGLLASTDKSWCLGVSLTGGNFIWPDICMLSKVNSFHVSRYASLLALFFKCLSAFRSGIIPHLGGARWASTAILAAGQPGQRQRSCHQLSGLSERHICGGQDAPACGQVRHMQRGHRESKAALWMMSLSFSRPWLEPRLFVVKQNKWNCWYQLKLLVSTRRVFGFSPTNLLNAFVSLLVANKERPGREEVCSLSMQLSADLQSHIAEDRLCQALLVRKSKFFFFSHSRCAS